jgi:hypothetical protein
MEGFNVMTPFATATTTPNHAVHSSRPVSPTDPMPWGRYKGNPIHLIPRDYLAWCLKNMDACNASDPRYWPEFTRTLESIVGAQQPLLQPATPAITLAGLLSILAARGVKLSITDGALIMTGEPAESLPDEIAAAIVMHRTALKALVSMIERPGPGAGSARVFGAADLRCRVKSWYGKLSRQFHPDAGGSNESQKAVNACYRSLMTILDEWEATR